VSHSYQTYFGFPGSDRNLDCGLRDHVIMRFASVGIRSRLGNKVISFYYFYFFSVPLSFSVFLSILLFFMSVSSKQKTKKKGYISSCYCVSNYMSILKRKKRKRVGLVEFWRIIKFLPQKYNSWWTIKKPHLNQLKLHILFIGGKIASYIKLGLILISFAWGFNSRFNSAAETLLLVNHKKTTLESIWTSYSVYRGLYCTIYSYLNVVFLRF
jgi:hypothetical protein